MFLALFTLLIQLTAAQESAPADAGGLLPAHCGEYIYSVDFMGPQLTLKTGTAAANSSDQTPAIISSLEAASAMCTYTMLMQFCTTSADKMDSQLCIIATMQTSWAH